MSHLADFTAAASDVYPTRRQVHHLNDDEIIERVCDAMQQSEKLATQSQSRIFESSSQDA
ncbi:hypothetical protein FOMPIDRAFT_1045042 [Fomitopsis schrenkii]|uniref:Uncharacterized protein n=1 Tax=Fomitopsis schrenkii TaxID=2126942 RepID=S8ES57_FOMSC|nr:hypothetical protein FOMPIDRAFT_1045042 [Fomitopsis schrenkii]